MKKNAKKLLDYIYQSPTAFHAVANAAEELTKAGFKELIEKDEWDLALGGKYFVRKNDSAFMAFIVGADVKQPAVRAIAAHTDSPTFVIKPSPQMVTKGHVKLNTSPYGGGILSTWFDRPLALAGRILLKGKNFLTPVVRLVNINRPLVIIPNLAIHLNREVNNGVKINPQVDTLPFVGMAAEIINDEMEKNDYLMNLLTKELGCKAEDILDFDLTLYEYAKGHIMGEHDEFISSARLDDLWMVYGGLTALKNAKAGEFTKMLICMDNEEVGSLTTQGAQSRFVESVLRRIALAQGGAPFCRLMANSFMISADCAHGASPNYPEKDDPTTTTLLGGGPVLKYSANYKYATTGYTAAIFKALCEKAGVPCQGYITRSDVQGGSTVGAMMGANLGIAVVDMGLAILGMHSIRELGSVKDNEYLQVLFNTFFA